MTCSIVTAERWSEPRDFPGYLISDQGRVQNKKSGRLITPTVNRSGVAMVGLMYEGKQYKRSLGLLIATEFVPQPPRRDFDTPIHLNGYGMDNAYTNLLWRPRWFAQRYMRQFTDGHATFRHPVQDSETLEIYDNSMHAATTHGLIDLDLWISMMNRNRIWPTGQTFVRAV